MPDQPFRFRKPRKLPGQKELSDDQWAELADEEYERSLSEEIAAEVRAERSAELRLPANLKALRLRLGLKQAEMAALMGAANRSLHLYEAGERSPTADFLSTLYVKFGIDLHKLFTGAPYEPSQDWKAAFSKFTLQVAHQVAYRYPELTPDEADALVTLYMSRSVGETKMDSKGLMMCYDDLFKPDEIED